MINYNIINEFIEKLKAGKTTASDINAIAEAYKNGELTNTVNLIEVENIKAIPSSVLEDLNCGDTVVKNENGNKHAYVVTYKEHHQGICLTYVDASMCETQSYDYVTDTWTYNSQDTFTFVNYTAGTGIDITSGVISGAYTAGQGININGAEISAAAGEVWESVIQFTIQTNAVDIRIFTNEQLTSSNFNSIVYEELSDKILECFMKSIGTTPKNIVNISVNSSNASIKYGVLTYTDSTPSLTTETLPWASSSRVLIYSHKLN